MVSLMVAWVVDVPQLPLLNRKKCELPKTNKRFLGNLVISAVSSNRKRAKLESHDSSKHVREQDPEWKRKVEHEKLPAKMEHREGSHKKQSTSKDKKR